MSCSHWLVGTNKSDVKWRSGVNSYPFAQILCPVPRVTFIALASTTKLVWCVVLLSRWWKCGGGTGKEGGVKRTGKCVKRGIKKKQLQVFFVFFLSVIAVEPIAFITVSWLLMNVERAEGMRPLQPLPSEIGPAVARVGEELQRREAGTCLKDGKVCHCLPVNIHRVGSAGGHVFGGDILAVVKNTCSRWTSQEGGF